MIINFKNIACGGGKAPVIEALSIVANGTYTVPEGVDGYSPVDVNVPTGGEEKFRIQNGTRFYANNPDDMNKLNLDDYNWEDVDNIDYIFGTGNGEKGPSPYLKLLEIAKRNKTKIKVLAFNEEYSQVSEIDFRGLDLSECYCIQLLVKGDGANPTVLNFSGCDLSSLEIVAISFSNNGPENEYKNIVNFENCKWGSLVDFQIGGIVQGLETIDFSKSIYFPGFYNIAPDLSKSDFSNVRMFGSANEWGIFRLNTTAILPPGKIEIVAPGMKDSIVVAPFLDTLDFSGFDLTNIGYLRISSYENNCTEIKGLGSIRSPYRLCFGGKLLTKIDLSGVDLVGGEDSTNTTGIFDYSPNMTDVLFPKNIQENLWLSQNKLLSKESLLNLIDNLYNFGPEGGKKMSIGQENIAKLLPEDIDRAKAKGWTFE